MDRHCQHVVVVIGDLVLVEVVTDSRPVGEELLDSHPVVDKRQVSVEHRPGRRAQAELATLHEAHHRQRSETLRAAGDGELRVDRRRDVETTVRQAICPLHGEASIEVDSDQTRQAHIGGDRIDQLAELALVVTRPAGIGLDAGMHHSQHPPLQAPMVARPRSDARSIFVTPDHTETASGISVGAAADRRPSAVVDTVAGARLAPQAGEIPRRRRESNPGNGFCRPVPNHSATSPCPRGPAQMNRQCRTGREITERHPGGTRAGSGRRGSNPRPQPWQGCALPTELLPRGRHHTQRP